LLQNTYLKKFFINFSFCIYFYYGRQATFDFTKSAAGQISDSSHDIHNVLYCILVHQYSDCVHFTTQLVLRNVSQVLYIINSMYKPVICIYQNKVQRHSRQCTCTCNKYQVKYNEVFTISKIVLVSYFSVSKQSLKKTF
jgi:hypothetical protein